MLRERGWRRAQSPDATISLRKKPLTIPVAIVVRLRLIMAVAVGLVVAEHFRTLRGFELQLVPGQPTVERIVGSLRALVMLESSIFISMSPAVASHYRDEDRRALSHWASESAAAAEAGVSWPSPPTLTPGHSVVLYEVLDAARQAADSSSPQVRL